MSLNFRAVIDAIDAELAPRYQPGAYVWIDDTYAGAWTAAVLEFQAALDKAAKWEDMGGAILAGEKYKAFMIAKFREYKALKNINEAEQLLLAMEGAV